MNNMSLYETVRSVPEEAKKKICAGRLKGFTDINPMWRIKTLTEQFGACGTGWYIEDVKFQIVDGSQNEKCIIATLNLYIVKDCLPSKPIFGVGGAKLITKEKEGFYTNDEAYKMAYTDAISVACKALGIGADVYFEKDCADKYNERKEEPRIEYHCAICGTPISQKWAEQSEAKYGAPLCSKKCADTLLNANEDE